MLTEVLGSWANCDKQPERIAVGATMDHRSRAWLQQQEASTLSAPLLHACAADLSQLHVLVLEMRCSAHAHTSMPDVGDVRHGFEIHPPLPPPPRPPQLVDAHSALVCAKNAKPVLSPHEPLRVASDGGMKNPSNLNVSGWSCSSDQLALVR